jgi:hypothetical protein
MSDALTGGCNCGAVRFEISEPPAEARYCHCQRCQRRTGTAASATATPRPGTCRIVSGAEHLVRWNPGGGVRDKVFCGTCGSAMFIQWPGDDEVLGVRLGSFDTDPGVRPSYRQYLAYAAPWEPIPDDGLPRYDERAQDRNPLGPPATR